MPNWRWFMFNYHTKIAYLCKWTTIWVCHCLLFCLQPSINRDNFKPNRHTYISIIHAKLVIYLFHFIHFKSRNICDKGIVAATAKIVYEETKTTSLWRHYMRNPLIWCVLTFAWWSHVICQSSRKYCKFRKTIRKCVAWSADLHKQKKKKKMRSESRTYVYRARSTSLLPERLGHRHREKCFDFVVVVVAGLACTCGMLGII